MKYYTPVSMFLLAGLSHARPRPQFLLPSFDLGSLLSSLPKPTGGVGAGSGFSIPSFGGIVPTAVPTGGLGGGDPFLAIPTATGGLGVGSTGLLSFNLPTATNGLGSGEVDSPTSVADLVGTTPTATDNATQPTATGGQVASDCTAQSTNGGSTENGVADKNCCTDLTVIFARGTTEPGNVGIVAGPKMFASLRSILSGGVTVQGIDYPADAAGNSNLGASGGPALASSVKAAKSQCPNTKIVVSGYSQGAMVVHNALNSQGISSADGVVGAVLFGDPLKTQKVGDLATDKIKQFCGTTDSICGTGDNPTGGHTSYGSVGDEAATWVISAAGLA